jgi:hypothetical protein
VDVRRLVLDRLEQDEVEQADDLVVLRRRRELLEVDRLAASLEGRERLVLAQLGHHLGHRRLVAAVVLLDQGVDLVLGRDHGLDLEAHQQTQVVDGPEVVRALHRDRDRAGTFVELDGHDLVGVGGLRRQGRDDLRRELPLDVHHPHAGLAGHRGGHVRGGDVAELDEQLADALVLALGAAVALEGERLVHLLAGDLAQPREDAAEATPLELRGVGLTGWLLFHGSGLGHRAATPDE